MPRGRYKVILHCTLDDCDSPYRSKGYCSKHYQRWVKYGYPYFTKDMSGPANPNWRGGKGLYSSYHQKVYATRGPAGEQVCADCSAPANEWSHEDCPDQVEAYTSTGEHPTCPHPECYRPRCTPCHRLYDHPTPVS